MAHSHSHSHSTGPAPLGPLAARVVIGALALVGLLTVVGALLLWPGTKQVDIPLPYQNSAGGAVSTESGHVLSTGLAPCGSPSAGAVL
ncbi:MAG: YibE/F family protein, partial [Mycobacterium sp.]